MLHDHRKGELPISCQKGKSTEGYQGGGVFRKRTDRTLGWGGEGGGGGGGWGVGGGGSRIMDNYSAVWGKHCKGKTRTPYPFLEKKHGKRGGKGRTSAPATPQSLPSSLTWMEKGSKEREYETRPGRTGLPLEMKGEGKIEEKNVKAPPSPPNPKTGPFTKRVCTHPLHFPPPSPSPSPPPPAHFPIPPSPPTPPCPPNPTPLSLFFPHSLLHSLSPEKDGVKSAAPSSVLKRVLFVRSLLSRRTRRQRK